MTEALKVKGVGECIIGSMTRERIAFDIDDVLANTTDALRIYVNENTGLNLSKDDYKVPATYWGYYEHVWSAAGIHDHSWIHRFHEQMGRDQSNIRPVEGSEQTVNVLSRDFDLVAVTSRELFMEQETKRWVHQHFGGVFEDIVLLGHIHTAKQTKGDACKELDAQYLFDDNLGHCQSAQAVGATGILFGDYGWHEEDRDVRIDRCKDMPAVLEYFANRIAS